MIKRVLGCLLVAIALWLGAAAPALALCTPSNPAASATANQFAEIELLQRICSNGFAASVSITRTNDTNALTANDIIGAATGATAAVQFTAIGPTEGGEVLITSVKLEINAAAVISGETSYNLYLYNVTPPSALGDNAAFDIPAGDRASRVAKISLGTPVTEGSTLLIETDIVNKQVTVPAGGSLFGYLVTVGAYTPTASRVYKITLHAIGL